MLSPASRRGFTLIEMAVVLAIMGILMAQGAQSYRVWLGNSQIRTAAQTLAEGLSAARNEAIGKNSSIDFRLMSDLSASCAASSSGTSWVVSVDDPSGKCDVAISDSLVPYIVAKKSARESTGTVTVAAIATDGTAASRIRFNGVGRVVLSGATPPMAQIDIDSSVLTADQSRKLRVVLTPGGMIRMCDPAIKPPDSRSC